MDSFGKKVQKLREKTGMSQRQLAFAVDVTPTYMSKIERGEFAPPSEEVVKKIAFVLNCDADRLLAHADKVDSDLLSIIKSKPEMYAAMLRKRAKKDGD